MSKRRAETICCEVPLKRRLRSLSSPVCVKDRSRAVENVLSIEGRRCTIKRQRSLDEDDGDWRTNSVPCRKRKEEDQLRAEEPNAVTLADAVKTEIGFKTANEDTLHNDKVISEEEDLECFNTFQYWRAPLPELDLSELQDLDSDKTCKTTMINEECTDVDMET
ncbi:uncharacterized protein C9orf40 homolog [Erpetoichthys calabaricus]|uniref:uncharacterized protein C9orf40 homolog n=1 Tax=Erpetoichthys calabaricus TaxID=27687 RepID=UPI0010A049FA|nr:uncharacterized protein C9orf40 homolog [Erpetoichthys calabaricus]